MNYNWNVYKVFKNGKRAKSPITVFESGEETMTEIFEREIKPNFSAKLRKVEFKIIRADSEQTRESEVANIEVDRFTINKKKVLSSLLAAKKIDYEQKPRLSVSGALILCKESDWKWQWAAIETATSRYLTGLSETFNTSKEAEEWIQQKAETI